MSHQKNPGEFTRHYFKAMSNAPKTTWEPLEEYIPDQELIGYALFFDTVFPGYKAFADEITAEGKYYRGT